MKITVVAGARPNFIKIAPLMRAFRARPGLVPLLVHTGQHYDERMSDLFFRQLGIPEPAENLEVGSASHAVQTAEIMRRFETVLLEDRPDLVCVVGDVNSTLACALVAAKLCVPVAHVEAGLRSFDRTMPEEINRLLTDAVADLLFATEESALANLRAEGVPDEKIHLVGNVMIDTLLANREAAARTDVLARLSLAPGKYAVLTLHRPSNVDDGAILERILRAVSASCADLPVVFPAHPRTRARLEACGLGDLCGDGGGPGLRLLEPVGYLEFLHLMSESRLILTDSGGMQEEATILRVPCITLRDNTERPVTVSCGANVLAGSDPGKIRAEVARVLEGRRSPIGTPPLWDGHAAERIADVIEAWWARRRGQ